MGHGTKASSRAPKVVNRTAVVTGMTGGGEHSLVLTATGTVLSIGRSTEPKYRAGWMTGKLGLGAGVREARTLMVVVDVHTPAGDGQGGATENSKNKE